MGEEPRTDGDPGIEKSTGAARDQMSATQLGGKGEPRREVVGYRVRRLVDQYPRCGVEIGDEHDHEQEPR